MPQAFRYQYRIGSQIDQNRSMRVSEIVNPDFLYPGFLSAVPQYRSDILRAFLKKSCCRIRFIEMGNIFPDLLGEKVRNIYNSFSMNSFRFVYKVFSCDLVIALVDTDLVFLKVNILQRKSQQLPHTHPGVIQNFEDCEKGQIVIRILAGA